MRQGDDRKLTFQERCAASLAGGVLSCAATIPLDGVCANLSLILSLVCARVLDSMGVISKAY